MCVSRYCPTSWSWARTHQSLFPMKPLSFRLLYSWDSEGRTLYPQFSRLGSVTPASPRFYPAAAGWREPGQSPEPEGRSGGGGWGGRQIWEREGWPGAGQSGPGSTPTPASPEPNGAAPRGLRGLRGKRGAALLNAPTPRLGHTESRGARASFSRPSRLLPTWRRPWPPGAVPGGRRAAGRRAGDRRRGGRGEGVGPSCGPLVRRARPRPRRGSAGSGWARLWSIAVGGSLRPKRRRRSRRRRRAALGARVKASIPPSPGRSPMPGFIRAAILYLFPSSMIAASWLARAPGRSQWRERFQERGGRAHSAPGLSRAGRGARRAGWERGAGLRRAAPSARGRREEREDELRGPHPRGAKRGARRRGRAFPPRPAERRRVSASATGKGGASPGSSCRGPRSLRCAVPRPSPRRCGAAQEPRADCNSRRAARPPPHLRSTAWRGGSLLLLRGPSALRSGRSVGAESGAGCGEPRPVTGFSAVLFGRGGSRRHRPGAARSRRPSRSLPCPEALRAPRRDGRRTERAVPLPQDPREEKSGNQTEEEFWN